MPCARCAASGSHGGPVVNRGGVFADDFIDSFIEMKMVEVMRFEMTPHPVEYDMYYSV